MINNNNNISYLLPLLFTLLINISICSSLLNNNRPVIGILTLPCDDPSYCTIYGNNTMKQDYFPASYVKLVESSGARVVPIRYWWSNNDIISLLQQLNGVLFTGGGASLDDDSIYFQAIQIIVKFVMQANMNNDYFPLWGTCLGFEAIVRAISNDANILSHFSAEDLSLPLNFTAAAQNSRILGFNPERFGALTTQYYNYFSNFAITYNAHEAGVTPANFLANNNLQTVFTILATNVDKNGKEFVSLIEGNNNLPIYAAQFHAEKVAFEWNSTLSINHSRQSILANNYLIQYFVDEARYNAHSFTTDLDTQLIYNYSPIYSNGYFTQVYIFNQN